MVRKQVHAQVVEAYGRVIAKAAPKGIGFAPEAGKEQDEDGWGFLVSAGGYKAFKVKDMYFLSHTDATSRWNIITASLYLSDLLNAVNTSFATPSRARAASTWRLWSRESSTRSLSTG
jgi:hypothetical protein